MTAEPTHMFRRITRIDLLLLAAAIAGGVLYVVLLPGEHPDVAASYALGETAARQAADAFLAEGGYTVDGYDAPPFLRRDPDLLDALQASHGRRAARRVLLEDGTSIPVFRWSLRYRKAEDAGDVSLPSLDVRLTSEGEVWDFARRGSWEPGDHGLNAGRRVDRRAFETVVMQADAPSTDVAEPPSVDFSALSDSLLTSSFSFNPAASLWQGDPADIPLFDSGKVRSVLAQYQTDPGGAFNTLLEPAFAVALVRYHLDRTLWRADDFRIDSTWLSRNQDNRLARIRLSRVEPLYGQQVQADATVSVAGALLNLDVSFERDEGSLTLGAEAGGDGVDFQGQQSGVIKTLNVIADAVQGLLIVVIGLAFVVIFFKRLGARLIDGKAVLLDLMVIAVLMALFIGLLKDAEFTPGIDSFWLSLLVRALLSLFVGCLIGLVGVILSGAADSVARVVWAKKLRSSSLVRLGAFRNVFVGAALLRGVGVAFVLLGLAAGFLFVFPGAAIDFENSQFLYELTWLPMTWQASGNGLFVYLIVTMILLGVATWVYRLRPKAWLVVGAVAVTMALMQGTPVKFEPVVYTWLISGLWGLALGLAFWHFDFLTCFTGYFVASLFWSLNEGWLVEASPVLFDVGLAGLFVVGLVALGAGGVASGKTRSAPVEYVPAYITELKQQERLRSELDVAREVQESFLPRAMPEVAGLDIAAMCLAAYEIGGDYYDFIKLEPGKLAVVVGDVSGKGTQAAFYMTLTKGFVQTLSREGLGPAEVMRRLNMLFCENVTRGTFISMIYGVFDVEARAFTFARAGHNPVILKRSPSQEPDMVQPTGLAIGLVTGARFDDTIEERTLDLRIGDVLVFYTDGFSEAMNQAKDQYGDDRLARKVSDLGQRSATEILHAVAEDVHHFVESAGRHDDMTMVVVKFDRRATPAVASTARQHAVA